MLEKLYSKEAIKQDLVAGGFLGFLLVIYAISYSSLICGPGLTSYLSEFISILLVSQISIALVFSLLSSFPNIGAHVQALPTVLVALVAASLVGYQLTPEKYFATVYAAVLTINAFGTIIVILLGVLKLGNLVRYVPYPVTGGLLAGVGAFLFLGAWPIIFEKKLDVMHLDFLFQGKQLLQWLPPFLIAVFIYLMKRIKRHPLTLPLSYIFFSVLYFVIYYALQILSISAGDWKLFIGPFDTAEHLWPWYQYRSIVEADWSLLYHSLGDILSIVILAPIGLLTYTAQFEVMTKKKASVNHELNTTGIAAIVSAIAGGGAFGFISLPTSSINFHVGAKHRIVNVIGALICLCVLLSGNLIINNIPSYVAPTLIFYISFEFLVTWLFDSWWKLSKIDYSLVVLIFLTILLFGVVYGIILGLAISFFKFVLEYSRIDPIKTICDGKTLSCHGIRNHQEYQVLEEHASSILFIRLRGYVFFGNAYRAFKKIDKVIHSTLQKNKVQYLIIDFSLVSGLDSSCHNIFTLFLQVTKKLGIDVYTIALFNRSFKGVGITLEQSGFNRDNDVVDFHSALEICEDRILTLILGIQHIKGYDMPYLSDQLKLHSKERDIFTSYWVKLENLPKGYELIQDGSDNKDIYFLSKGSLEVRASRKNENLVIARVYSGGIVGEISYYTEEMRKSSVVSIVPSDVYVLKAERFQDMERQYPHLACQLDRFLFRQLSEKMDINNRIYSFFIKG